jgi:hypothetical protein
MEELAEIAIEKLIEVIVQEINEGKCMMWCRRKCSEKKKEQIRTNIRNKLSTNGKKVKISII